MNSVEVDDACLVSLLPEDVDAGSIVYVKHPLHEMSGPCIVSADYEVVSLDDGYCWIFDRDNPHDFRIVRVLPAGTKVTLEVGAE